MKVLVERLSGRRRVAVRIHPQEPGRFERASLATAEENEPSSEELQFLQSYSLTAKNEETLGETRCADRGSKRGSNLSNGSKSRRGSSLEIGITSNNRRRRKRLRAQPWTLSQLVRFLLASFVMQPIQLVIR